MELCLAPLVNGARDLKERTRVYHVLVVVVMNREQTEGELYSASRARMQGPTFVPAFTSDLKAFEQRLMDCVAHARGKAVKWKGGGSPIQSQPQYIWPSFSSSHRRYFAVVWNSSMDLVGRRDELCKAYIANTGFNMTNLISTSHAGQLLRHVFIKQKPLPQFSDIISNLHVRVL